MHPPKKLVLGKYHALDLSHSLHPQIPTWSGGCGFHLEIKLDYEEGLRVQSLKAHAGIGTHLDAPSHFIQGSWNADEIPLENLIVPVCVLHLKSKMDPNLFVSPEDIEEFEKKHGGIPRGSLVLAHTGWDQFWNEPHRYRNPDAMGKMRFPGFSKEAAELLLEKHIAGIGIDTLSPDGSNNSSGGDAHYYPVHELILSAKKYILENVAHLAQMPPTSAYAIVLPLKMEKASEAPIRIVGLIPAA